MNTQYKENHTEKFYHISFVDQYGNISGICGTESDPNIIKFFRDQAIKELRNKWGGNKEIHK